MSKKMKRPESWQVRKITYGLVAVVIGVLGWVGWVDEATGEKLGEQATALIPWVLGVIAPAVAASKTHAGSDSTATDEDRVISQSYPPGDLTDQIRDVADRAEQTIRDAVARVPDAGQVADAVLAAIRAEERGEHVTVNDPAAAAASAQSARANAASALAPGAGTKSVAAYYAGEGR